MTLSRRAILFGPSIDHSNPRAWVRATIRKLRVSDGDICIAVDGGLAYAPNPQIALGDWDSADRNLLRKTKALKVTLKKRKDRSDLAYALEAVKILEPDEVILIGFTGGRPDHHLSNLLEINAARLKYSRAIGPEAEYHFLTAKSPKFQPKCPRGTLVSVFALGKAARDVTMRGFEYRLTNQTLEPSSRGLSNRTTSRPEIRLKQGTLLVVIPT